MPRLARVFAAWFDLAAVLLVIAALVRPWQALTDLFLRTQDVPVLGGLLAAAALARIALSVWLRHEPAGTAPTPTPAARGETAAPFVIALALFVGLAGWAGSHTIMESYPLSLDEFMAEFGAVIHGHGLAMAPVDPAWRPYLTALQPQFMLRAPGGGAWTSSYFPGNALLRSAAGLLGDRALASALLSAFSVIAVWRIGLRLWPQAPRTAVAAAVLLATSAQVLFLGMTPYAMSAHLALNLLWLWLFLRGGVLGHAGALATGFLACGLHQLAFHPLFVLPFGLQLLLERRWAPAALYAAGYAGIILFWADYGPLIGAAAPTAANASLATGLGGPVGLLHEADGLTKQFRASAWGLMAANMIRLQTWQNPLTAPLLLIGAWGAVRAGGPTRSLLLGLPLTALAMLVLVPYQGHGWGYRYLHGLVGSACLVAADAWTRLQAGMGGRERAAARVSFAAAALGSALILVPVRAMQANGFLHPYASAEAAIRRAPTDLVLVDDSGAWFGQDFVRNDPFLRNRPIALDLNLLSESQIEALCARHSIAVFLPEDAGRFGVRRFLDPRSIRLAAPRLTRLREARCGPARTPVLDVFGDTIPPQAEGMDG